VNINPVFENTRWRTEISDFEEIEELISSC